MTGFMRAAVYRGPGRIAVERVAVPETGPGDLLVRVRRASLCATDHKVVAHGHFKIAPGVARILGHEFVGEVVESKADDPRLGPGSRVAVAPNVGCGRCRACLQGLDNLCPAYEALGLTLDGGLAEYVRVPAVFVRRGNVVPLSEAIPDDAAALIEPLSTVVAAHEAVGTRAGDRVAIIGAGPMGLMHVMVARALGAAVVVAVEPLEVRGEMARRLGADAVVPPEGAGEAVARFTAGEGFDVVVVTVPLKEAQQQAVGLAAVQGRVHLFAGLPRGSDFPSLDTNAVHYRQLVVTGTTGSSALQFRRTAEMVAHRRLDVEALISERVELEEVPAVLAAPRRSDQLKTLVTLMP
ncbi:MAG TPA: alcohol dehydrogenase catalytic domain-containing protein [Limnochordales bacterium]